MMRSGRFGGFLLATGAAVGVAAVVGLVLGFEPSRLPPALLDIAAYKLTFLAAAGLLAAGAIIRRRAQRDDVGSRSTAGLDGDSARESPLLPEARVEDRVNEVPPSARVPRRDWP
jgi:hypothetical protein